jgi:adenylate cyclase
MFKQFLQKKIAGAVVISLIITILATIGLTAGVFNNTHLHFADSLYKLNEPSDKIIIIGVDDKSTQPVTTGQGYGRYAQWTRDRFTELLDVLKNEDPAVITLDFVFHTTTTTLPRESLLALQADINEQKNSTDKLETYDQFLKDYKSTLRHPIDQNFAAATAKHDNLVMAMVYDAEIGEIIKPLNKFSTNATLAFVNTSLDDDGIIRRTMPNFDFGGEEGIYDDIALATVKKYLENSSESSGLDVQPQTSNLPIEDDHMLINFFGEPRSFQMIPFIDAVQGNYETDLFKDKIVLIGPWSSKEFHDEVLSPRSNENPMPGVEFRANEIQTILENKFLHNQTSLQAIATAATISLVLALILSYLSITLSLVVTLAGLGLYWASAHYFYRQGLILNMVYPFLAIILTYLGSWVYKYFISDRKKRELKGAFSHYVSEDLVNEISRNPDLVKLGGEKREVTVFFSDIKGSTTHSETTKIEDWVAQINEYFTVMEGIIKRSGGTLDKYEGDAIMAFWNAPIAQENHVERGYTAALEMRSALLKLHEKWGTEGKPLIEFRIGINTGEALVGNFGSETRFDYTVMGDTVNTASRLESAANKAYGTHVCVAGGTTDAAAANNFIVRELDSVLLPGKKEAVKIYELLGLKNLADAPQLQEEANTYHSALAAYRCKDFASAIQKFSQLGGGDPAADSAAQIMLERCQKLQRGEVIAELDLETMTYKILNK